MSTEKDSIKPLETRQSSLPYQPSLPPTLPPSKKWYEYFGLRSSTPRQPAHLNAHLPEKERWREWQKAKDKEQAMRSTAAYSTRLSKVYWAGWGAWLCF